MSTTSITMGGALLDYGSTYGTGTVTHYLTQYKASSGALVFGAGTIQWPWGLDATHDRGNAAADVRMQQATVNLLADMGVQPATLRTGLVAASASTDAAAPTSTITAPSTGSTVAVGTRLTISGTASDSGGVVGGVEVSVDGGTSWHPAVGRGSWTYDWTPASSGTFTIRTRATDDSGNLETPGAGITVTAGSGGGSQTCPCTLFTATSAPTVASDPGNVGVNLGVKFTSEQAGVISAIRFYKGSGNTGTHVGALWSSNGTLLASATFVSETASGWQQVNFATPVAINASTVYVASYFAPNGHYAADGGFFSANGVDRPPLHAPSGSNGVYAYSGTTAFPNSTFQSTNYWVDVVFSPGAAPPDTTPPTVTAQTPTAGSANVPVGTTVTATFSESIDPATVGTTTFALRDSAGNTVAATVGYDTATRVATLRPNAALAASTTYTATVRGGSTDPRIKDLAGNALAADATWSFTTAAPDTTAPTISAISPANNATGVSRGTNVTATFSEAMDPATINTTTFELRTATTNALVAATVTYDATTRRAILNPNLNLAATTRYTATVKGGSTDPRVKDAAGNALAANRTWSFTTR
jgi:hypothetical protein